VVKAESLMPIAIWRPTFTHHHGPWGDYLRYRKDDLVGVDLASRGLPPTRDLNGSAKLTREKWISMNWLGHPPHPRASEHEAEVPEPFQRQLHAD
jgi:hypothetical protein